MRADALEVAVRDLFAGNASAKARIRRLVLRAVAPQHPDGLARTVALRMPGKCVFCEDDVPGSRVTCAGASCAQAYQRAYQRDMRHSRGQPVRNAHARE